VKPETDEDLSATEEDWRRFLAVESMVNHWERPGWTPDREAYFWYLTFNAPPLTRLAERCQQALRLPYLDPVPLNALHLTLPRIGWADETSSADLDRVSKLGIAALAEIRPFQLSVGPVAGSPGAVRFSVSPWKPLVALNTRLRTTTEAAGLTGCGDSEFRPHIGIAYCNQVVPSVDLHRRIRPLRRLPAVSTDINRVELVRLRREGRTYEWSTIRTFDLHG